MKTIAHFQARFLEPITRFMGKNDVRYYLNGFQIEPCAAGGVILMATNGHIMLVARDPNGWVKERMIIIAPDRSLISAAKRKGMGKLVIQQDQGSFANGLAFVLPSKKGKGKYAFDVDEETQQKWVTEPLSGLAHVSAIEFIDYEGVNWRRVVPEVKELEPQGYSDILCNSRYLARFDSVFDYLSGLVGERRRLGCLRIQAYSQNGPMVIRPPSETELDAVGVIMPMRGDRKPFDASWMEAPKAKPRMRIRAGESQPLNGEQP